MEQEHSYPILGAYNEYVDVCIGEQEDGFFRPVVYLLTKDGVVEYVEDVYKRQSLMSSCSTISRVRSPAA